MRSGRRILLPERELNCVSFAADRLDQASGKPQLRGLGKEAGGEGGSQSLYPSCG